MNITIRSGRCVAGLILLLNSQFVLRAAEASIQQQIINPLGPNDDTIRALEANQKKQIEAAKSWKVFHDFQFSDHYAESGITFEQHPVDDAAKNYKAVH